MVKILEIGEQLDADQDDDCCEIDPAEFAKKVNLKASDDDLVIVAAKGPIIKVKVEHFAKTLDGYINSEADCFDTNGNLHEFAAGDSMDNPYEIDEDEATLHKMENDADKTGVLSDGKCIHVDEDKCRFEEVIPDKSLVKCEPLEEAIPESLVKCEPFEEAIPDESLVKCEPFEEAIPDESLVQCEPEDCNGVDERVEEDAYDHIPEMDGLNNELYTGGRVFDEEEDDDFIVVGREAL